MFYMLIYYVFSVTQCMARGIYNNISYAKFISIIILLPFILLLLLLFFYGLCIVSGYCAYLEPVYGDSLTKF
jgi:hypothetical protein